MCLWLPYCVQQYDEDPGRGFFEVFSSVLQKRDFSRIHVGCWRHAKIFGRAVVRCHARQFVAGGPADERLFGRKSHRKHVEILPMKNLLTKVVWKERVHLNTSDKHVDEEACDQGLVAGKI